MRVERVTVVGAGVLGLWQALLCARAGFQVRLVDQDAGAFEAGASVLAGGMLAPDCEGEAAPKVVRDQGRIGIGAWRDLVPGIRDNGSLVVAGARDQAELSRFAKMTSAFERLDGASIDVLEPGLAGRFASGLLFPDEAHFNVPQVLAYLMEQVRAAGCDVRLGEAYGSTQLANEPDDSVIVDCRGMGAQADPLPGMEAVGARLRGVRGERVIVQTDDVRLNRPVRLLHPRHPIYVVPWDDGRFVVGATVIESADTSGASVRSVLELLGAAFALHPAFGEAEILDVGAGVRPAYPDNVPRAVVADGGRVISVNGAYRHGFLLAPVLADVVSRYLQAGHLDHPLLVGAI